MRVSSVIVLVLAVDTSTPAVTAGVVRLDGDTPRTLATRITVNARAHAEVLTPHILECLAEAGHGPADLDAVVVGAGRARSPGLRVGMATAAAFADALGIPVHGVCSLDAIASEPSGQRCWWSPTPGAARCTGPGTATASGWPALRSTRPPTSRCQGAAGGRRVAGARGPVPAAASSR